MAENHMPQSNSLMSEIFIFISGGFNLAVSLGWSYQTYNLQFRYCWFIGTVIGAFLAAPALQFLRGRHVLHFACCLALIGGIVTVSDCYNVTALIAARYLNGISVGLATVEFIVRGSEIAAPKFRAFCLGWEQTGLYFGAFIQMLYAGLWSTSLNFSPDCLRGIFCIVCAVLALITSYFYIESPVRYLLRDDYETALNCVKHLSRPSGMSEAKQLACNELRDYVTDSESRPIGMSMMVAQPPLLKMVLYRAMLAFIMALPLNVALVTTSLVVVAPNTMVNWPPLVYGLIAAVGIQVGRILYGFVGVKLVSLFGLLIAGVCTIAVGALFDELGRNGTYQQALAVFILLMIAQFFGSFFAASTTIYLGEAFPLHCKSYFVALCVIVQYLVDLIIVCTFTLNVYNIFAFCVAAGVIMCVLLLKFVATVPETRNTTLREAELRFARWRNHRSY